MQRSDLKFRFKGDRQYVHGTDMYNQTLTWLREAGVEPKDIDFAFHRIAKRQLTAIPGSPPEGAEPVAVCTFTAGGERQRVALVERAEDVGERYAYPEDEIVSAMEVDLAARRGVLRGQPAYSDIEILVAMTKALHQRVFSDLKGKWLFTRARFPQYVRSSGAGERTLTIVASFNGKLTRSEVLLDGVKAGEIYFSLA